MAAKIIKVEKYHTNCKQTFITKDSENSPP